MKAKMLFAVAVLAALAYPLAAQAQGIPGGIEHGAAVGNHAAGPVGAVVGGAVGGVVGGVQGLFGIQPASATYPEPVPPAYRYHPRYRRHSHRSVRHYHRVS